MNRRILLAFVGFFAVCGLFMYLYDRTSDEPMPPIVPQVAGQTVPAPAPDATPPASIVEPPQKSEHIIIQIEQNANAAPYCYIGEFNGRLSIYASSNSPIPDIITDIPLSILPQEDQETVRKGFFVYSQAELSKLLEDLGS